MWQDTYVNLFLTYMSKKSSVNIMKYGKHLFQVMKKYSPFLNLKTCVCMHACVHTYV